MCSHIEDDNGFVESAGTINLFPTPLWVTFYPHYTKIPSQYTGCPWYQLCWQLQLKYYMCITQHKMFSKYLPMMSSRHMSVWFNVFQLCSVCKTCLIPCFSDAQQSPVTRCPPPLYTIHTHSANNTMLSCSAVNSFFTIHKAPINKYLFVW